MTGNTATTAQSPTSPTRGPRRYGKGGRRIRPAAGNVSSPCWAAPPPRSPRPTPPRSRSFSVAEPDVPESPGWSRQPGPSSQHQGVTSGTRQAGSQRPQEAPGHPRARHPATAASARASTARPRSRSPTRWSTATATARRKQGRLPQALDPADQRRRPRQRHDLQPLHPGPQASPVSRSTARSWPTWPSTTPPAFAALVETAKAALPEDVNAPGPRPTA